MPCFCIYNTFKCHFKPNQKCQRDMNDPVVQGKSEKQKNEKITMVQNWENPPDRNEHSLKWTKSKNGHH